MSQKQLVNLCKLKSYSNSSSTKTPFNDVCVVLKWLLIDLLQSVSCVLRVSVHLLQKSAVPLMSRPQSPHWYRLSSGSGLVHAQLWQAVEGGTERCGDSGCLSSGPQCHACAALFPPQAATPLTFHLLDRHEDMEEWWVDEIKSNKQQERDRRIKPAVNTWSEGKNLGYLGLNKLFFFVSLSGFGNPGLPVVCKKKSIAYHIFL